MKRLRAALAVAVLALTAGITWAAGVNGLFDATIANLTAVKADITVASDIKKIDAAIATLQASSTTTVQADVKALQTAISKLGKLATSNATVAAHLETASDSTFIFVVGRAGAAVFQQGQLLTTHTTLKDLKKAAKGALTIGKTQAKLEAAQNNAALTPLKKVKIFLACCKAFDKVTKGYGGSIQTAP